MQRDVVLTFITDDRPGIVETLAQTIAAHKGNWQESQLSLMAGKFAGILRASVASEHLEALQQALEALASQSISVTVQVANPKVGAPLCQDYTFTVLGSDRPGIVREIAQAFNKRHINMGNLITEYSSMPWSGEPLFSARGSLEVPTEVDVDALHDHLDSIADELALDIALEHPEQLADVGS